MNKDNIKFVCWNCGEVHQKSKWDNFIGVFNGIVFFIGLLALVFLFFAGDMILPMVSSAMMLNLADNRDSYFDGRSYGSQFNDLDGRDSYLTIVSLMDGMDHLPYVPASLISPMQGYRDTLQNGGDCKNLAVLFVNIMLDSGYVAFVDCDPFVAKHCVARIPYAGNSEKFEGTYAIVDLTWNGLEIYPDESTHWVDEPLSTKQFMK